MTGPDDQPEDDAAMRAKLDAIAAAIRSQRPVAATEPPKPEGDEGFGSAMSLGLRAGSEFVGAIVVGTAIGWGVDWLFHTKPLFIILFFLLGVAAATLNVIRAASPKGAIFNRTSRLSDAKGKDKDVPRNSPPEG